MISTCSFELGSQAFGRVCTRLYKITKIVRSLWLAERSVCIRVCKHGCGVKLLAFRALITQAQIWKSFSDQNSTRSLQFAHSFVGWNLENLYKQAVSTFFQILSEKNPYFGKHLFAKQELITRARPRVQDFATGKNFSFNQCHKKEFRVSSQESYCIKAIENFFPMFA